jgi:hypothetical protein
MVTQRPHPSNCFYLRKLFDVKTLEWISVLLTSHRQGPELSYTRDFTLNFHVIALHSDRHATAWNRVLGSENMEI